MEVTNIENLAEELARKFNSEGYAPFPFDSIKKDRGDFEILALDSADPKMTEVSGAIVFDTATSKFKIFVNENKQQTRQYFTLAHELGHYFLHSELIKSEGAFVDSENSLDSGQILFRLDGARLTELAREANHFAASLIMPRDFVIKIWLDLKSVEACARVFKVSLSAMSIRLERLGLAGQ